MKKYWTNSFDPGTAGRIYLSSDRSANVFRRLSTQSRESGQGISGWQGFSLMVDTDSRHEGHPLDSSVVVSLFLGNRAVFSPPPERSQALSRFRMESPLRAIMQALWTSRSRMGVARVWSPKTSPHSSGSSCSSPGRDSPFHTAGREAGKRDWRPPGRGEDSRSRLKSGAWEASASTGGSPAVFRPGPSEAFPEGLRKTKTTPGTPLPRPCPPRKWPGGSFRPRVARGRPRSMPAPQTTVPPPPGKGEKPKTQGSPSVSRDQRGWGGGT